MDSHILKHAKNRTETFRPNPKLDNLIERLQALLSPVQESVNVNFSVPQKPVIAIVGCPRSGTTFTTQLLAETGAVSYPSNILSRFSYAPYIGALIQKLLLDPEYDFRNELADLHSKSSFVSDVGKTEGALGISEFFHFWRRFFPQHDPGHVPEERLKEVQVGRMRRELASIQAVFEKPFMCKAMMLQYNLSFFAKQMPELVIIHVTRDPLYLMQSVSQARMKYYGTDRIWWSVKPKEYSFLKDEEAPTQVAGQVLFTDQAIEQQISELPENRWVKVKYEDICNDPHAFLKDLAARFELPELGVNLDRIQSRYPSSNTKRMMESELQHLLGRYRLLQERSTRGGNL